jgi:DNA repair protein RadC
MATPERVFPRKSATPAFRRVSEKCSAFKSNMVHNHPSGDPTPSKDDIAMTREVKEAADKLGIVLHDHIIVGRRGHASFKALGLI